MTYISCDIDGILTDYPNCWLDYLASCCGIRYQSIDDAKRNEKNYKLFKHKYRISGYKGLLKINASAVNVLSILKYERNFSIIIATSRPLYSNTYPNMYKLTITWLMENHVPFDFLEYKELSAAYIDKYDKISFHIDDEEKYAIPIAAKGVPVFLVQREKMKQNMDKIINISSLDEVFHYV